MWKWMQQEGSWWLRGERCHGGNVGSAWMGWAAAAHFFIPVDSSAHALSGAAWPACSAGFSLSLPGHLGCRVLSLGRTEGLLALAASSQCPPQCPPVPAAHLPRGAANPSAHPAESKIHERKADYQGETVLISAAHLWQCKDLEIQLSSFSLYLCNPNELFFGKSHSVSFRYLNIAASLEGGLACECPGGYGTLCTGVMGSLNLIPWGLGGLFPLPLSGWVCSVLGQQGAHGSDWVGKHKPVEMWAAGFFLNVSMPFEARALLCPNMLFVIVPCAGRICAPKH